MSRQAELVFAVLSMSICLKRLSHLMGNTLLGPIAATGICFRSLRLWFEFRLFRRQQLALQLFRERRETESKRPRLLVVITHIVSEVLAVGGQGFELKVARLIRTLDSLLMNFAHCEMTIVINTCPNRHLVRYLPDYLTKVVQTIEHRVVDPALVEFLAQDIFIDRRDNFDWFFFLEDDILINDSYLLEKLTFFNNSTLRPSMLLTPHLFEMLDGRKYYVNLLWPEYKEAKECAWNALASFYLSHVKFGECDRPHCACYFLNREQLELWRNSGRRWNNQTIYIGPIESAASFCLFEVFTVYKPHRDNLHFLEVQHWDTKYSLRVYANSHSIPLDQSMD